MQYIQYCPHLNKKNKVTIVELVLKSLGTVSKIKQ